MGQVILKTASVEEILADVKATVANARALGGDVQQLAEQRLAPVLAQVSDVVAQLGAAREALLPLRAAVKAKSEAAAQVVGQVSDEVWNAVGRPASDPSLTVLFPGGVAHYTGGDLAARSERLELLAQLLLKGLHPRLPETVAKAASAAVHDAAVALRSAIDAARAPQALFDQLERQQRALATVAQRSLAGLKRMYASVGLTEADIHAVIPDRPVKGARKQPAPPPPTPEPPLTTPAPTLKSA